MSKRAATEAPRVWRPRIVGFSWEPPDALTANPDNWRVHTQDQRDVLLGLLGAVGWVAPVIQNDTTGYLLDGHERVADALTAGEGTVPVIHVALDPDEERLVLATLDPISALASTDPRKQLDLLANLGARTADAAPALVTFIAHLGQQASGARPDKSLAEFPALDDDLETAYRCPACHYEWSGRPKPGADDPA